MTSSAYFFFLCTLECFLALEFVDLTNFCIREPDEPGPADMLQSGGEAAGLHSALRSEWEDGRFAGGTAAARPAALRGPAAGRRVAGCSSARG